MLAAVTPAAILSLFISSPTLTKQPPARKIELIYVLISEDQIMSEKTEVIVGLAQMPTVDDLRQNLDTAAVYVKEAAAKGADIVCLPEMFACPYQNEAFVRYREPAGGTTWQALSGMAKENHVILVGGSFPEEEDGLIYNTCFVFDKNGTQIARHRKMHLFDIDVKGGQRFKESDTFTAGSEVTVFDTEFGRFGVQICFDIRFPELGRLLSLKGAKGVFIPAAFNMTTGPAHWELNFRARALDNQAFYFGCSPARDVTAGYVAYGHSIAVDPWGTVTAQLEEKAGILITSAKLSRVDSIRAQLPLLSARRTDLYRLEELK